MLYAALFLLSKVRELYGGDTAWWTLNETSNGCVCTALEKCFRPYSHRHWRLSRFLSHLMAKNSAVWGETLMDHKVLYMYFLIIRPIWNSAVAFIGNGNHNADVNWALVYYLAVGLQVKVPLQNKNTHVKPHACTYVLIFVRKCFLWWDLLQILARKIQWTQDAFIGRPKCSTWKTSLCPQPCRNSPAEAFQPYSAIGFSHWQNGKASYDK